MKSWTVLVVLAMLTTGCTSSEDRIAFDGQYYRAKLKQDNSEIGAFSLAVRPVSNSLNGAVAAGEYEAISYCVGTFGSSDISWAVGPETPQGQLPIDKDVLAFQGKCTGTR